MQRKYITYHVLMACLSHNRVWKKDIYAQLEETIAERKRILPQFENLFLPKLPEVKKDIHAQLAETLEERKRILQQLQRVLSNKKDNQYMIHTQQAA